MTNRLAGDTIPQIVRIATERAPEPNGHYSQAVSSGDLIFLSMQLPLVHGQAVEMPQTLEAQVTQVILNCQEILRAAQSDLNKVLTVTVYLADVADWRPANDAFAVAFGDHRPARSMVPVTGLHLGARVAMQMTAVI